MASPDLFLAPAPPALRSAIRFLVRLHRANSVLFWTGALNVALALLALALLPFDHRTVTGLAVWMKPLKFSLSITAFVWTLGWLLAHLPASTQRSVRRLSWGVGGSMAAEQAVIFLQAARGTTSHFNIHSALDGALFGVMGWFILINTAMTVWALWLLWWHRPAGPDGAVWGMRLGLLQFVAGSLIGGVMIHLNQHTVGAPDGGPGLPALGWSTRAGDLRAAHFLGLHALQALPLLGWALSYWVPRRAALLVWVGATLYAGAVAWLFALAMAGKPLLAPGNPTF